MKKVAILPVPSTNSPVMELPKNPDGNELISTSPFFTKKKARNIESHTMVSTVVTVVRNSGIKVFSKVRRTP